MSKNNRYRIVVENTTLPSHRMKKMPIVEAYLVVCRREEDSSDESEQGEMDEDEEEEIPLDMEVDRYFFFQSFFISSTWIG